MPSLKLFCGRNKGFIFTLDATITSMILISTLIVSSVYISKSREEALPGLQMLNVGYDILNLMAQKNLWNDGDANSLIDALVPPNYYFIIKRQCGTIDTIWYDLAKDADTPTTIPTGEIVVTGYYAFVKSGPTYCRARFYVWLK